MEITQEKLAKLYQLYDELDAAKEASSDAIKEAQEGKADKKATITRKNGETVEVTEKELWDEIFYLKDRSEGWEYLKSKYPKAFETSDAVTDKLDEIRKFTHGEFGLDPNQIKLSDIFRIVEAVLEYKMHGKEADDKEETTATKTGEGEGA